MKDGDFICVVVSPEKCYILDALPHSQDNLGARWLLALRGYVDIHHGSGSFHFQ